LTGVLVTGIIAHDSYREAPLVSSPEISLVGNHPALDFTNTVGGWEGDRVRDDRLASYGDLLGWGRKAGLLALGDIRTLERLATAAPDEAGRVFERAIDLRVAIYRIITAAATRRPPAQADLARLNREVARARSAEHLVPDREHYAWRLDDDVGLERPVQLVAAATAALLVEGPIVRIHRCPGENCGWLFLDTSRGGRRRWCDMATCGNLDKVRRFRRRAAH
jgi:predicted RNA-binding Zn ribbon-like protein